MPYRVEILAIDLGDNPITQWSPPGKPLDLLDAFNDDLLRSMRTDLLEREDGE